MGNDVVYPWVVDRVNGFELRPGHGGAVFFDGGDVLIQIGEDDLALDFWRQVEEAEGGCVMLGM